MIQNLIAVSNAIKIGHNASRSSHDMCDRAWVMERYIIFSMICWWLYHKPCTNLQLQRKLAPPMSNGRFGARSWAHSSESLPCIPFQEPCHGTYFNTSFRRVIFQFQFSLATKDHSIPSPCHFHNNFSRIRKSRSCLLWKTLCLDNNRMDRRGRRVYLVESTHLSHSCYIAD